MDLSTETQRLAVSPGLVRENEAASAMALTPRRSLQATKRLIFEKLSNQQAKGKVIPEPIQLETGTLPARQRPPVAFSR